MEIEKLKGRLRDMGIVGAGGAGFPTYAKIDTRAETIILNCAECEPLLRLHRQLLEKYAGKIVETFCDIGRIVGAKDIVIAVKKGYRDTIDALNEYIGQYPKVRIHLLEEIYPAGDELILVYEITGKVIRPGGIPIEEGVVVFNVETVYNVFRALNFKMPVTEKFVSVAAEVRNPVTVCVPVGCSVRDVVAMAGGVTTEEPEYLSGGPMMGAIVSEREPITKTTNAIIVLPKDHIVVQKKKRKPSIALKRATAACCQCSMCTDLCPRNLLGYPIEPHKFMQAAIYKDLQETGHFINTLFCSSCGLCEMYSCVQSLAPRSLIAEYKTGLQKNGVKPPRIAIVRQAGEEREFRKVPMDRLISRLDLNRYDRMAPLEKKTLETKEVKIMLKQHIGVPATAVVNKGDIVEKGQVIAKPAEGLSVAVHASICGKVVEVNENFVIIRNRKDVHLDG